MVYTIGTKAFYYPFLDDGEVHKKGAANGYQGGTVWRSYAAAREYLDTFDKEGKYDVFGVLADWETQTRPSIDGGDYHDLLVDALIVDLRGVDSGG